MLKTWDFEDRESHRAQGRTAPAATPLRGAAPEGGGRVPIPGPRPDLPGFTEEMTSRWVRLVASEIGWDELDRETKYLVNHLPLCGSCRLRSATVHDHGHRVCASCVTAFGDYADQAWQDHKSREEQQ